MSKFNSFRPKNIWSSFAPEIKLNCQNKARYGAEQEVYKLIWKLNLTDEEKLLLKVLKKEN